LLETVLAMLAPTYVEQKPRIEITAVRQYVKKHYSEKQWKCIDELWQRESSWQTRKKPWRAKNPSSGAYGIPQSLPAKKMATHGWDYLTNPIVQVNWGMQYISQRFGTPCKALAFHDRKGWY
jgi:resuscitation-promoting factor RpfB